MLERRYKGTGFGSYYWKLGKFLEILKLNSFIDGEVSGEIVADKVEIGEKGKVFANIFSTVFVIQEGGIFEGIRN